MPLFEFLEFFWYVFRAFSFQQLFFAVACAYCKFLEFYDLFQQFFSALQFFIKLIFFFEFLFQVGELEQFQF